MEGIITAWGRILRGYRPALSVEITRECPLRCPGCYAYGDDHLGGDVTLRQVSDFKGQELVDRFFALIDEHQPIHVSIVGGEPLVRFRELDEILPRLAARGIYTQVVTSAVRPIPLEWAAIPRLQMVVSIDGLQPEHDVRRTPATYDRILKHINGHQITVHCTVTRQQVQRDGYLEEFVRFWSENPDTHQIWVSLYTPQVGEVVRRTPDAGRSRARRRRADASARPVSEAEDAGGADRVYAEPPQNARRLHLRADDDLRLGRFRAADHAVPVRRDAGLRELRLHRVGRARRGRPHHSAARGGLPRRRRSSSSSLSAVGRDRAIRRVSRARRHDCRS